VILFKVGVESSWHAQSIEANYSHCSSSNYISFGFFLVLFWTIGSWGVLWHSLDPSLVFSTLAAFPSSLAPSTCITSNSSSPSRTKHNVLTNYANSTSFSVYLQSAFGHLEGRLRHTCLSWMMIRSSRCSSTPGLACSRFGRCNPWGHWYGSRLEPLISSSCVKLLGWKIVGGSRLGILSGIEVEVSSSWASSSCELRTIWPYLQLGSAYFCRYVSLIDWVSNGQDRYLGHSPYFYYFYCS